MDQQVSPNMPIELFRERAKEIIRLADSWDKHQTPVELENLVEGIHRLKQTEGFQALLKSIPNRAMSPSARQNLANIIKKVSRYRESARYLYRTARKIPIVRRARIVVIDLPKEAFCQISNNHTACLASAITRIGTDHRKPSLGYLNSLLSPSNLELNDQFADQTVKSLSKAKIHAEVQLVLYYELRASRLPPRVVCSSKDACFLCNTFITMHGKMHTPRCHGRLYPGWRLPSMSQFSDLQLRLNESLEEQIKKSLQELLVRKEKTRYPCPNESTVLTLQVSTSTLRTTSALVETIPVTATESAVNVTVRSCTEFRSAQNQDSAATSENEKDATSVLEFEHSMVTPRGDETEALEMAKTTTVSTSQCESLSTSDNITAHETQMLVQGIAHTDCVDSKRGPQFYPAGALEIHMESTEEESAESSPDRENSKIAYSIEWLSVDAAKEFVKDHAETAVDVEAMQCQTSCEMDYHNNVVIMARGDVVRIMSR